MGDVIMGLFCVLQIRSTLIVVLCAISLPFHSKIWLHQFRQWCHISRSNGSYLRTIGFINKILFPRNPRAGSQPLIYTSLVVTDHKNKHLPCCWDYGPSWLTHWGLDKMADIFQTTFANALSWMKMSKFRLRFHWILFPRVQYGPVTMIVPASGHQVRCIPWVQMGTFNKEIGFLCGLKFFALNIFCGEYLQASLYLMLQTWWKPLPWKMCQ